jgi:hypothetical protein
MTILAPRILFLIAVGAIVIGLAPQIARAQPRCWGSSLIYIVRDERGKVINADYDDLWIGSGWDVTDYNFGGNTWATGPVALRVLPDPIRNELGKSTFLAHIEHGEPCNFTKPIELRLTFHGKSMNLIFHAENKNNVIVDSLPFQQGTFENELSVPRVHGVRYSAAQDWKKVAAAAEAVPPYPLKFVRGRVIDSITGKPVADARVSLESAPKHEAATYTDKKGFFDLNHIRADWLEKVVGVAVLAAHPDYEDEYATVDKNDKGSPFESVTGVTVKLVPRVTVSGRVFDEKTGTVSQCIENASLTFKYGSKDLLGTKVSGEAETTIKADGTFTIKTGAGKNSLSFYNEDCWGFLADENKNLDVGKKGRSDVVLKVVH